MAAAGRPPGAVFFLCPGYEIVVGMKSQFEGAVVKPYSTPSYPSYVRIYYSLSNFALSQYPQTL